MALTRRDTTAFESNIQFFNDWLATSESTIEHPETGNTVDSFNRILTTPSTKEYRLVYNIEPEYGITFEGVGVWQDSGFRIPASGDATYIMSFSIDFYTYLGQMIDLARLKELPVNVVGSTRDATVRSNDLLMNPDADFYFFLSKSADNRLLLASGNTRVFTEGRLFVTELSTQLAEPGA